MSSRARGKPRVVVPAEEPVPSEPLANTLWRTLNSPLSLGSAVFLMLAICVGMGQALYESKHMIHTLHDELRAAKTDLYRAEVRLHRFEEMEPRTVNFRFIDDQHETKLASRTAAPAAAAVKSEEADKEDWEVYLNVTAPKERSDIDCSNPADVILSRSDVWGSRSDGTSFPRLTEQAYTQGLTALRECGFVYLEDLIPKDKVQRLYQAFARFRNTSEAMQFRFHDPRLPGFGDEEFMIPFRSPFNNSGVHTDVRVRKLLEGFLGDPFKMELVTVSSPSSRRTQPTPWYQAYTYLFHPSERLPPYSAVVSLPLVDIPIDSGSTHVCPGKNLRYYEHPRCDNAVNAATKQGTVLIMDSKVLRRKPGVLPQQAGDWPVMEMTFSKLWFSNLEAYIQRPVSFAQSIHQRRYWEQWIWHPEINRH